MKKGVIALVVLLALVIIVSPGIIGKMAEKNVDASLNRAADHSGELVVTSTGFDGGWFSSEGEHRIEIGHGSMRDGLGMLAGNGDSALPVLVINTHLDHGIIPVSSMTRDNGTLAPGLGSAVSTLRLELSDGEVVDLPGKIYSDVALDGDVTANYIVEQGSRDVDDGRVEWQPVTVGITADAAGEEYEFSGDIGGVTLAEGGNTMTLGAMTFAGNQQQTEHNVFVGDLKFELESILFADGTMGAVDIKGISLSGMNRLDDDRIVGDGTFSLDSMTVPGFGDVSYMIEADSNVDAAALGKLMTALDGVSNSADTGRILSTMDTEGKDLFAAGLQLNVPQFDVTLPMGTVETVLSVSAPQQDRDGFEWTSLLLQGKANLDMKIPEALVMMATSMSPEAGAMIAAGYLKKDGDYYVMDADMEKGLLTINGAPIPIPLGAF